MCCQECKYLVYLFGQKDCFSCLKDTKKQFSELETFSLSCKKFEPLEKEKK